MQSASLPVQPESRSVSRRSARTGMRADDIFFTTLSVLMLAIVFMGFGSSYYLRGAMFSHLASPLVHVHGAVFSSWMVLFVVQSSLVSAGNIRLHRRLGVLGAVLAGLMVILGVLTPIGTLRRGAPLPPIFTPASFLIGNILGILLFGAYVAVAIWKRKNRMVHKRLLLIANCMLLEPALSRMAFPVMPHPRMTFPWMAQNPFLIGVIPLAIIFALFLLDLVTNRRALVVTLIGGLLFWGLDPVSDMIVGTQMAQNFTHWVQKP